jgi:alpha-N-acetylglucosaminidase
MDRNMLNNFGGNINLFGRMEGVASGPALALKDSASKRLCGIGLTMEGIEQNPVIYELMMQHTWQTQPVQLDEWLKQYVLNRYRVADDSLVKAWQLLRVTAYNGKEIRDGAESIVTGRPTFDSPQFGHALNSTMHLKICCPCGTCLCTRHQKE